MAVVIGIFAYLYDDLLSPITNIGFNLYKLGIMFRRRDRPDELKQKPPLSERFTDLIS